MTTYTYNLRLDDSESIALQRALKCYLSPEIQVFIAANPSVGLWGNTELIRDIVEKKLSVNVELISTNNFHQRSNI